MKFASIRTGLAAVAASCALVTAAFSAPADYTFEPVQAEVKVSPTTELGVRLVHKPSGKPVAGAVMFRSRLDMSPDGMAEHTSSVDPGESKEPGVYPFKADVSMAGRWALKVIARIPGEAAPVEVSVVFNAKD